MLAKKTFDATSIGSMGTMTMSSLVSVGASADESGYERFAAEVAVLEEMEQQGKLRIDYRHQESSTGKRYVDLVRFTRLT